MKTKEQKLKKARQARKENVAEWFFGFCLLTFVLGSLVAFANGILTLLALTELNSAWRIIAVIVVGILFVVVSVVVQQGAPIGDALGATFVAMLITGLMSGTIGNAIHYRRMKAKKNQKTMLMQKAQLKRQSQPTLAPPFQHQGHPTPRR